MKYEFTDFFYNEQNKIDKLRESGLFVYAIRDGEGKNYTIERKAWINRIGFLITDTEILGDETILTDSEFYELCKKNNAIETQFNY